MATEIEGQQTPDRPPKTELKRVRYVGRSDIRRIRADQLKAAGLTGSEDLVWNSDNDYSIAVKGITADVLDVLAADKDFVLE